MLLIKTCCRHTFLLLIVARTLFGSGRHYAFRSVVLLSQGKKNKTYVFQNIQPCLKTTILITVDIIFSSKVSEVFWTQSKADQRDNSTTEVLVQEQICPESIRNFGQVFQIWVTEPQVLLSMRLTRVESICSGDSIPLSFQSKNL